MRVSIREGVRGMGRRRPVDVKNPTIVIVFTTCRRVVALYISRAVCADGVGREVGCSEAICCFIM
jgi:hypothetical protein